MKRLTAPRDAAGDAATRITRGSRITADRLQAGLETWVRAARRDDLTGWRASLGPLMRLVILGGAGYALLRLLDALPWLMWALTAGWCWKAWNATAPEPLAETADTTPSEPAPAPAADLARWLLDTIGEQPGIHLRDLYPQMRHLPGQQTRSDADLRAALRTRGVPLVRSLRIGRIAGRSGIRRDDLQPLLPCRGEHPGDSGGDAGQSADSPGGEWVGEQRGEDVSDPLEKQLGAA